MEYPKKLIKSEKKSDWLLSYRKNITSQFGEDGIIEKIFELIGNDGWRTIFRFDKSKSLIRGIKNLIKKTPFYNLICSYSRTMARKKEMKAWNDGDRSGPPPFLIKQKIIKEYAHRFAIDTFVETGTYLGEMVGAVKDTFKEIFSIELDDKLFKKAKEKFSRHPYVHIIHGDSGEILPEVLSSIKRPCLFWLDAHYSGGMTAKGNLETPIVKELGAILNHSVRNHILLIDDAHCFTGQNDYPTIEWLKEYILGYRPDWVFEVVDNIIRIHPPKKL